MVCPWPLFSAGYTAPVVRTRTSGEQKAGRPSSFTYFNIGSIFGIGFPTRAGGALQFIDGQGAQAFAKCCTDLAAQRLARALC